MTRIKFHQQIMQGLFHLNALTHLDVVWYDVDYRRLHGITSFGIPSVLDFDEEREYPLIEALCRNLEDVSSGCYCSAVTASFLEFIFIPILSKEEAEGLIRVGPFITNSLTEQQLSSFLVSLHLPLTHSQTLRHFYGSVPMLQADVAKSLGHIGLNLFGHHVSIAHACLYQSSDKFLGNLFLHEKSMDEDISIIEHRYDFEHQLTKAVSSGKAVEVSQVLDRFGREDALKGLLSRFPENPLRATKNIAIVFNTILRHAAEKGGVHPVHIHRLSSKYALLIEHAGTRTAVQQLHSEMPHAYAELVRQYAFAQASPFIRRIQNHIMMNLDKPLSQSGLATHFGLKPPNLANQFKHETGQTVTTFIHVKRIEEACHHLRFSNLPIQEISRYVGINDTNYFSRLFRTYLGITPMQYRNGTSPKEGLGSFLIQP